MWYTTQQTWYLTGKTGPRKISKKNRCLKYRDFFAFLALSCPFSSPFVEIFSYFRYFYVPFYPYFVLSLLSYFWLRGTKRDVRPPFISRIILLNLNYPLICDKNLIKHIIKSISRADYDVDTSNAGITLWNNFNNKIFIITVANEIRIKIITVIQYSFESARQAAVPNACL